MGQICIRQIYKDNLLGDILIRPLKNGRYIKFRISDGNVTATVPYGTQMKDFISDLEHLRDRISEKITSQKVIFQEGTIFLSDWLSVDMEMSEGANHIIRGHDNKYVISVPRNAEDSEIIKNGIYQAMKHRARQVLPELVGELSKAYGFRYKSLKINSSKGRWGSCNQNGDINISLYVMKLPKHLTSYIILHELCHTIHMEHSREFYSLLNTCSNGKSEQYKKELKQYTTDTNQQPATGNLSF